MKRHRLGYTINLLAALDEFTNSQPDEKTSASAHSAEHLVKTPSVAKNTSQMTTFTKFDSYRS